MEIKESRKALTWKNTIRLAIWTSLWTISMALVVYGAKYLWDFNTGYSIMFILLNVLLGIGMIRANILYLKGLDELMQKIYLDAMGISLGTTLVGGLAYSMLDTTNVIGSDAEISVLVILMAITYLLAIVIGQLRYK